MALFHEEMAIIFYTSSYNMMNRPTDKEEGNHDNHNLETGGSLRAPELCPVQPLEIQRGHSEVTATHTSTRTHIGLSPQTAWTHN